MKKGGEVAIEPFAASLPELSLLMSPGWYLMVMEERDAAAASTSAVVS